MAAASNAEEDVLSLGLRERDRISVLRPVHEGVLRGPPLGGWTGTAMTATAASSAEPRSFFSRGRQKPFSVSSVLSVVKMSLSVLSEVNVP